jgi:nucleoid DNA-binding protein
MPFGVISSLISDFFDLIIVTMSKEKDVYFTGFGRFCYAKKDGEPLISFKPDKDVTEAIRKLTEERRARMEK